MAKASSEIWTKKAEAKVASREKRWSKVSASKNLDAHYWTCNSDPEEAYAWRTNCKPGDGFDEDEDEEEEDVPPADAPDSAGPPAKVRCDGGKTCFCNKSADDLPNHPYILTSAAIFKYQTTMNMLGLREPGAFGMYTFNDHGCYGALEVLQNLFVDFDEAFRDNDEKEMWVNVETIAMYMSYGGGDMIFMCDDAEAVKDAVNIIAKIPLAAIYHTERHNTWELRNLPWMLSLYIELADQFREQGLIEESSRPQGKNFKFLSGNMDEYLLAIAARRNIKLPDIEEDRVEDATDLRMPDVDKNDAWSWKTTFPKYCSICPSPYGNRGAGGPKIGGDGLDITTWSSAERKKAAYDRGKDPLKPADIKKLKEGLVMMKG